ncbi:hypothetical protein P3T18_000619 [Paraburkholderia sp. GAS199]|uniref:hypothetical protein n=1 Tax=Paraburkholderia sp. GAS199 TaxID=3035126 RepID=UPI003D1B5CFB
MPDSPSIGRAGSTLPLADTHTSPSPADSGQPGGVPHAGPEANGKLGALANNGSQSAAGKGGRASFAAKASSAVTSAASAASAAAQSAAAGVAGRTGRLGAFSQGAATLANGATGVASAGMSVVGGLMQLEQAATMQLAELIKQGAHNVEEASKG